MPEWTGKQVVLLFLTMVTFLTVGVLFNTENYPFTLYEETDGYRAPPMASYALRTTSRVAENQTLKPEANGGNYSGLHDEAVKHPENKCYRQVQIWRGKGSPQLPVNSECPGLECGISFVEDTSFETMAKSDALVLFHRSSWNWAEMQRRRPMNQAWVFYSLESPRHTGGNAIPPNDYDHLYNYTISYRPSSTIFGPYGMYYKDIPQLAPDENRNWAKEKTGGLVVWAASNCGTASWQRYNFVKTLARHISVDMYGGCGNKRCDRGSDDCWKLISSYKFYLAVENSECRDYITEKFWWNSLYHNIVPIVYGPPREDYERVAPPHSFIHLQDFKNFNELTDYINLLNSNDTLYNSYFEWKRHGSVRRIGEGEILTAPFLCKVVSKVLDHEKRLASGDQENEGENPSIHDFWSTSCFKAIGFPHNF